MPTPKFAKGLNARVELPSLETVYNTMRLYTTTNTLSAESCLIDWKTMPAFETIRSNLTVGFSSSGAPIVPAWKNVNVPVGDYKACGCCYAYSLAKVATARYMIHTNQPAQSTPWMCSVDQVLSCVSFNGPEYFAESGNSGYDSCLGCNGGFPLFAWYLLSQQGIKLLTDGSNPFQSVDGCASSSDCSQSCARLSSESKASSSNPTIVPSPIHVDPTDLQSTTAADLKSATADELQIMFNLQNDWEKTPIDVNSIINPNSNNGSGYPSTNSYDFMNDLYFYAAAMQHELVGSSQNKDQSKQYGGPFYVSINILMKRGSAPPSAGQAPPQVDPLISYTGGLFMYTESYGQPEGHAIMCTGFQWLDTNALKATPYWNSVYAPHMDAANTNNIYYLAYHLENQWQLPGKNGQTYPWGFNGSMLFAASFFLVVDSNNNVTTIVNDLYSQSGIEFNCAAGNFFAHAYPSTYAMLASRRQQRPPRFVDTQRSNAFARDYLIPNAPHAHKRRYYVDVERVIGMPQELVSGMYFKERSVRRGKIADKSLSRDTSPGRFLSASHDFGRFRSDFWGMVENGAATSIPAKLETDGTYWEAVRRGQRPRPVESILKAKNYQNPTEARRQFFDPSYAQEMMTQVRPRADAGVASMVYAAY